LKVQANSWPFDRNLTTSSCSTVIHFVLLSMTMAQPGAFDLMQIAPAGFVDHGVTVYVAPSERDFPG